MSSCIEKKQLILYYYKELETQEHNTIQSHLHKCERCQKKLLELEKLGEILTAGSIHIEESDLIANRNLLASKLNRKRTFYSPFSFIHPRPVFQAGFAVIILVLGFFIGREVPMHEKNDTTLEQLLTGNRIIRTENAAIQPVLLKVEKVKFNSKSGQVEIFYSTASDVRLRGKVSEPEIQEVLRHAVQDRDNPAVRLHALKAMNKITPGEEKINQETIKILQDLFLSEKNQGIKLTGLKVLQSAGQNETVKEMLIQFLLFDSDPAVRIEAFKALIQYNPKELQEILEIAQTDDNNYIRHKAEELLQSL
ncbi:HEAT repeat domain-containing protein [candidate division KSB1 bacterium]|nr:HEAT repeat domain-containing protein [candidate division KSB1 bacterium]